MFEAFFFAALTSTCFFWGVYLNSLRPESCQPVTSLEEGADEHPKRFTCPDTADGKEQYNTLATLVFNTEGGIIRTLLRLPITLEENDISSIDVPTVLIFLALWIVFTFITYGVWVPAGLFLPGIIIGSCIGLLYVQFMLWCGLQIW